MSGRANAYGSGAGRIRCRPEPRRRPRAVTRRRARRLCDVALAVLLLAALLPMLLVIAGLIKASSPGPVLFRQVRLGQSRRRFSVLKFRTMRSGASEEPHREAIAALVRQGGDPAPGALQKLTGDPRITPVGHWLRRTSLDELPQLLNVVRGQMSIVGPRPALEYELEHYAPTHFERFRVPPGLTGLWQVSGRSDLSFTEMLDLDAEYARAASATLDARILLRTPMAVLRGRTS
jgi:lipopolysaccharide/colanic/teichoic acid biosynthesis glycosyltransferase